MHCDEELISLSRGIIYDIMNGIIYDIMNVMRQYLKSVKCLLIVLLIILINDYTDT